jgi:ectoine hydroxylase-related dioxygenase (phytanoyl-CoA dioxygenase family)
MNFDKDGYVVIDLNLTDAEVNGIVDDVQNILSLEDKTLQADHYQYNEWPRVFEGWKQSRNIAELCMHPKIIKSLEVLYGKKTFPFSTINFTGPSNQPLHSDVIHFHTVPERMMVGVWVALEDTSVENGTLQVVPGSHLWDLYDYEKLGLPHPDDIENGEKENYRWYEEFIENLVQVKGAETKPVAIKKGQAIIWEANLLHGGFATDTTKTRKVQAIHYFFEGCTKYYHPMFSRPSEGEYADKWCNEQNNIRTYLNG